MPFPIRITYRNLESSEAIDAYVRRRAAKLSSSAQPILHCHVVLDAPHRHKQHGRHYRVHVALAVAGADVVVDRGRTAPHEEENLYACIDAAFDRAVRRLHDHAQRMRAPFGA
jgi:ribosomal subunit interface protein